jgi:hypothetical protein
MKLAALAMMMTLGTAGLAAADPGGPPRNAPLKQALLERFDKNHDGRLEPNERRHAIKALRKLTRKMAMHERRAERRMARERGVVRRYDQNRDGVVDPQEMPPGLAKKMQPLDRNGDGWLDDADQ